MKVDNEQQLHINMHLPTSWQTIRELRDTLHEIGEEARAMIARTDTHTSRRPSSSPAT